MIYCITLSGQCTLRTVFGFQPCATLGYASTPGRASSFSLALKQQIPCDLERVRAAQQDYCGQLLMTRLRCGLDMLEGSRDDSDLSTSSPVGSSDASSGSTVDSLAVKSAGREPLTGGRAGVCTLPSRLSCAASLMCASLRYPFSDCTNLKVHSLAGCRALALMERSLLT